MAGNTAEALRRIHENKRTQSKILDLGGLGLTELPDELWDCVWVEELALGHYWSWDEEKHGWIWKYKSEAMANRLSNLTSAISNFKQLNKLFLEGNSSFKCIDVLSSLSSLTELDLSYSPTSDISPLSNLIDLVTLSLNGTAINDISHLGGLMNLVKLNLCGTAIRSIEILSNLGKLTSLNLWGTSINGIHSLSSLKRLTELNLGHTSISDISPLSSLDELTELILNSTMVKDINPLSRLLNLKYLYLVKTPVSDINPLNNLSSLTKLYLSNTFVSDINPLSSLLNLTRLSLNNTLISDISPLSNLGNLTVLDLSETSIRNMNVLNSLKSLVEVNLSKSAIYFFPFDLLSLPKLEWLNLEGTHCLNIPLNLTHEYDALPDLRNYYAELQKSAYKAYDAKIITVGNGRVGKTSVLKTLFGITPFNPQEDSTHGIQLFNTTVSLSQKNTNVNLRLWDFGGQELYHATHRIFMKSRALYLLIWDPLTEQSLDAKPVKFQGQTNIFRNYSLSYWLGNIHTLSRDSKIIVICNRADSGEDQFPKQLHALQTQYKIDSFFSVSAQTGYNLSALFHRILYLLELMPEVGMPMPISWKNVQDRLATLTNQPYISMKQYQHISATERLSKDSAITLLRFLHHSGFLFWHEQYLHNQIILDQKWALEAIYQLLDRNGWYPLLKGNALRQRSELAKCWSAYSAEQVDLFLEMMQSCELALKLEDKQSDNPRYLIPEFLPDNPAPAVADIWEVNPSPIYHFRFQHPFFHAALIQRFIVRSAKLAERYDLLWRTGLLIKVDGTMALVQVYPEVGRIDMQLRGTNPGNLLERLKNEITEIQEVNEEAGFLLSLTGQPDEWVTLEQVEQQIKKGKAQVASTTGEILELAPFHPLLSSRYSDQDDDQKAPGLKELSDRELGFQLLMPTAPPNPLEGLKLLVKKELINEGIGAAITCLETHLHTDSTPATDLIVISSQFQEFNRSVAKGLHSVDEQYLLANRISNQVVALLTTIQEADLK